MNNKRVKIKISGTVQGVGFRPTVYRYACEEGLLGQVANTSQGVFIEVQGDEEAIKRFTLRLKNYPPPQAQIDEFDYQDIPLVLGEEKFRIIESLSLGEKNVAISPDLATCQDCRSEIFDPKNRRYGHAFTNCTNCGPRFTIIHDRPYDRILTSMAPFEMCELCKTEYHDPMNRRFHAQPNACPECGPKLHLIDIDQNEGEDALVITQDLLKKGKIAAIKGLGGFNIACDPLNAETMKRLREVKRRPHRSFALMMRDLETVTSYCEVSEKEKKALLSPEAPIVLLKKKNQKFDHTSPDNNYLGVMLPYTPLHHLLMAPFEALVMTSANLSEEPMAITDQEVQFLIDRGVVDFALSHNREIVHRADDSIVQFVLGKMQTIRRSRGLVPRVQKVTDKKSVSSLSLGANMKNTFALRKNDQVFLSQHIGELIDLRNFDYQQTMIKDFEELLDIKISDEKAIHCDAHPGYENFKVEGTKIQHHYAHLLSVVGEYDLFEEDVLGVIADGTGFGDDGHIWGFEFLDSPKGHEGFKRLSHLEYFPLPGGESALHEIDRIGISLMIHAGLDPEAFYPDAQGKAVKSLLEKKINSPLCSSLGRLFDGVASLMNIARYAEYEARAAILLQKTAENFKGRPQGFYPFVLNDQKLIALSPLIKEILVDRQKGISQEEMALKFHFWVCEAILKTARTVGNSKTLVFSGGCFQNALLVKLLVQGLAQGESPFYFNEKIPCNDAGISFGQSLV